MGGLPADLNEQRVLSRGEAAALLGLSEVVLDRLHAKGVGPARIPLSERRVGYPLPALREWQAARIESHPAGAAA